LSAQSRENGRRAVVEVSGAGLPNLDYSELRGHVDVSAPNRNLDPLGSNENGSGE